MPGLASSRSATRSSVAVCQPAMLDVPGSKMIGLARHRAIERHLEPLEGIGPVGRLAAGSGLLGPVAR